MASHHSGRARNSDRGRIGQPLPPIRTFLGPELTLPLPWQPTQCARICNNPRPAPTRRGETPFGRSHATPHGADFYSHPESRLPPMSSGLSPAPTSRRPESAESVPPAFAYNVLRPSRYGGLITTPATVRSRSRTTSSASPPQPTPSTSTEATGAGEGDKSPRKHLCPICQRRFSRPSILKTHMSGVHDGARPFTCSYPGCNQVFSVLSNMRRHYLRIHPSGDDHELFTPEWDDESSIRGPEV